MTSKALVLGGGGVTGIAWELGVIDALVDEGVDVRAADLVVGTSAGATVAAQITTGSLDELVRSQLSASSTEIAAELDMEVMIEIFGLMTDESITPDERRAKVGARALATETVAEALRRDVIEARLPVDRWPARSLVLTAVDAHSGAFTTFDASSGVSLVDAVAASCAVPGIWPPVTIGERRYVDGGVRSSTNADLASGHARVLILTPLAAGMASGLDRQLQRLDDAGSTVVVVGADEAALARIGDNVLDPSRRGPALEEGRRQGLAAASEVATLWADAGPVNPH